MPESGMSGSVGAAGEQSPVATRQMRNAEYAPTDTPKSIRLINCLKSNRFYRSSGARHVSNRSSASVLPIRVRLSQPFY
jgi:hypothetical protein